MEKLVFTLKETTKYWFGSIENTKLEIINKNEQEQSRMEKIETDCKWEAYNLEQILETVM